MNLSSHASTVLGFMLIVSVPVSELHAACSRDDIEFYLDKGFTPDQITSLCASPADPAGQPDTSTEESAGEDVQPVQPEEAVGAAAAVHPDDNEQFLQRAIKAKDIQVSGDSLDYTLQICVEYGDRDLFGFAPKACPDVRFEIARDGLEVTKVGKKYFFFGTPQVKVTAGIKREIVGGLKKQDLEYQQLILDKIEQGNETGIPIRDDYPLDQAEEAIQQLAL